ncbi:hypothetical protein pb186bvf_007173 [Paramecium bursaria]
MNNQQVFFPEKKRIHENNYAQVVVKRGKADKANLRLNENLFHAQQVAKQSTSLIKDIQKDVKSTLKKYDEYVKIGESNRVQQSESMRKLDDTNRKLFLDVSPSKNETLEAESDQILNLQHQQKVLLELLQNAQKQEILIRSGQKAEPSILQYNDKMLASVSSKQIFLTENISPIKQGSRQSTVLIDLTKQKRSSKLTSARSAKSMSPLKKSSYFDTKQSYANIHGKKNPKNQNSDIFIKRNSEWKMKVEKKIQSEQKRRQEEEMRYCTFRPKILSKTTHQNFSVSKDFHKDMNEIVDLIDELSIFRNKLAKKA